MVPAVEALSLNHWTTREVSSIAFCLQHLSGTFHLLPFIFVFIHWFNRHLLLNQSLCGRCYRGQKDETWPSLFIYYFSYSVTTYIKARTVSYSFSSHLLSSFFITHKKAWQSRSYCTFFFNYWIVGWIDGWIFGWMDGWMDEWMDTWTDEWLAEWINDV